MRHRRIENLDFLREINRFIGQTVTIFTTSGGESGRGFTGVLLGIDPDFVRLLSEIGPAPACALGSCCDRRFVRNEFEEEFEEFEGEEEEEEEEERTRFDCRLRNIGAIVDIPVNRIAAFVHNTLS